jgi:HPt (histidine-containing phosphotransfer) domain-containing protein
MSEIRDPAIIALLAEARVQFARSIPAKVADLRSLLERGAWDDLRRAAHKLRGSTGTYGFMELSTAAADVEDALIEAGGVPGPDVQQRVANRVAEATLEAERVGK